MTGVFMVLSVGQFRSTIQNNNEIPGGPVPVGKRYLSWSWFRFLVAALLLVAAGLKAYQLATQPVLGEAWLDTRSVGVAVVQFELIFGVWLISGIRPRLARWATLVCFTIFGFISLYRAVAGHQSCGCFGPVQVNPWVTFGLDAMVVVFTAAASLKPSSIQSRHETSLRWAAAVASYLFVGSLVAVWTMAGPRPVVLADGAGDLIGEGEFVILEPETWMGRPFPLASHIDIGQRLMSGRWLVVLYHHDCSSCRKALPRYRRLAAATHGDPQAARVALIELPPYAAYADEGRPPDGADSHYEQGRLTDAKEWFVQTPTVIHLDTGDVIKVEPPAHAVAPIVPAPGHHLTALSYDPQGKVAPQ